MTFIARQNRQSNHNESANREFGRGQLFGQPDQAQLERKLNQQELYKQQLQRQIIEKEERKKQEQEKIRKQDQKYMREFQQRSKKQRQLEDSNKQQKQKKQPSESRVNRIAPSNGNMNFSIKQQALQPEIPRLGFITMSDSEPNQNLYSIQRKRPYLYEQNQQVNSYYEDRIRRHKEQMNLKLDQLFRHIHSTKDNIKAQEQIDKIKRKLRLKQTPSPHQFGGQSQVQLQYENKFFQVPKPNRESYRTTNQERSRVLDYQSSSKFSPYKNIQSRAKVRTHNDDLYSLPDNEVYEGNRNDKWGTKPGKDNFLGNREAIDYQVEKTLGEIDKCIQNLNKQP